MLARDIMTFPVVSVTPETPVFDAVKLMLDKRISGVPIVEADGELVGLVSEGDLIRRSEIGSDETPSWWLAAFASKARLAEDFVKTHAMKVEEIMSRDVVTVADDAPAWKIAELLEKKKIKRVPVMKDGKIVGIVSRANLLHALAAQREKMMKQPSGDDQAIRGQVLDLLKDQPWRRLSHLNVVVLEGVVHYWGQVHSNVERQALRVAAETVPGVKEVVDHSYVAVTLI